MKYCTATDVVSLNPKRKYNTSSRPNLTQVSSHIAWISADMNIRMGGVGLSVPISTSPVTTISTYLRNICAIGAASKTEESAFMGGNKNESAHAKTLYDQYEKYMMAIEKNPSLITGNSAGFDSYEYSNVDERRDSEPFNRNEKDW